MKKVILHYHFFKNAGTSLDAAFKDNFSDEEWVTAEFSQNPERNREEVKQWILDNPNAKCFSSHTAVFPPPSIDGVEVIPVVFIRNPLDRIASAYSFEKKQGADGFGSVLARNTTLAGYIETRLSIPQDRQCRNFHTYRFSFMNNDVSKNELERALDGLKELPFVGVVEDFHLSLEKLEQLLSDNGFKNIKLRPVEMNVSRDVRKSIDNKMEELKASLGDELFEKLVECNSDDYVLYDAVCKKYFS